MIAFAPLKTVSPVGETITCRVSLCMIGCERASIRSAYRVLTIDSTFAFSVYCLKAIVERVARIIMIAMTMMSSMRVTPRSFMSVFLDVEYPLHRFVVALRDDRRRVSRRLAGDRVLVAH